jgi:hypothetical protein
MSAEKLIFHYQLDDWTGALVGTCIQLIGIGV